MREKYLFPLMNSMIDAAINHCQVAKKEKGEEPIKVTNIPSHRWDTVSIHHGLPYPDDHYNLVLIEKKSRCPVVEAVFSTKKKSQQGETGILWSSEERRERQRTTS